MSGARGSAQRYGRRRRVAAAPISWGVCEVPGWGLQLPAERVLTEMAGLGITAIETGPPGFLPQGPTALRTAVEAHGLGVVAGFVAHCWHRESDRDWREPLTAQIARLSGAGATTIVLAAAGDADGYDGSPDLSNDEWHTMLERLDEATMIAADAGLVAALHPHVGTVVERPEHIARVLDGSAVKLCLDTGHIMAGGGDVLAVASAAAERIAHVHLKDVDAGLAGSVADGSVDYSAAVRRGLYRPLGAGDVETAALLELLDAAGYDGWFVLEQDVVLTEVPPPGQGPVSAVAESLCYLAAQHTELADAN